MDERAGDVNGLTELIQEGGLVGEDLQVMTARAVQQLASLATYIDRLSAKFPLRDHPGLRAQMRRAAMDSLANTACALESVSRRDYRNLTLRSLGALSELETFSRLADKAGAVTPTEAGHLAFMVQSTHETLRAGLVRVPIALRGAA